MGIANILQYESPTLYFEGYCELISHELSLSLEGNRKTERDHRYDRVDVKKTHTRPPLSSGLYV